MVLPSSEFNYSFICETDNVYTVTPLLYPLNKVKDGSRKQERGRLSIICTLDFFFRFAFEIYSVYSLRTIDNVFPVPPLVAETTKER